MFVDPAQRRAPAYQQFWRDLNAGKPQNDVLQAHHQGRPARSGSRPSTRRSSDEMGRVVKIVKIATDVTAAGATPTDMLAQAVEQAQTVTAAAMEGDLSQRIPLDGKSGPIADAVRRRQHADGDHRGDLRRRRPRVRRARPRAT